MEVFTYVYICFTYTYTFHVRICRLTLLGIVCVVEFARCLCCADRCHIGRLHVRCVSFFFLTSEANFQNITRGAWVARSVKCPALGFGSRHDLTVREFCIGNVEPSWDSLSLPLCLSLTFPYLHCLCLCQNNFFFKITLPTFIYFWDRERQSMNGGGAEREGDTESETGSRLRAISPEPDAGLELTGHEIETWLKSDA